MVRVVSASLIVLVGGGLVVYGIVGKRPPTVEDCHETILDPDPGPIGGHPGTLHLLTCPGLPRTGYALQITDYWRNPPVIEWVFAGNMAADSGVPAVPLRAHWVTRDSLVVEYHPALRISHRLDTAGPVHLTWVPQSPAP
jgi:hypothetical protein